LSATHFAIDIRHFAQDAISARCQTMRGGRRFRLSRTRWFKHAGSPRRRAWPRDFDLPNQSLTLFVPFASFPATYPVPSDVAKRKPRASRATISTEPAAGAFC
jgi:hypothetical protein